MLPAREVPAPVSPIPDLSPPWEDATTATPGLESWTKARLKLRHEYTPKPNSLFKTPGPLIAVNANY